MRYRIVQTKRRVRNINAISTWHYKSYLILFSLIYCVIKTGDNFRIGVHIH